MMINEELRKKFDRLPLYLYFPTKSENHKSNYVVTTNQYCEKLQCQEILLFGFYKKIKPIKIINMKFFIPLIHILFFNQLHSQCNSDLQFYLNNIYNFKDSIIQKSFYSKEQALSISGYQTESEIEDENSSPLTLRYVKDLKITDLEIKPVNAIKYILKKAKKTSVIIINEAHNKPWHRDFIAQIIDSLDNDYHFYASETLIDAKKQIYNFKYPKIIPKYTFINEVKYGALIRKVINKKMQIIGYDNFNDSLFELTKYSDSVYTFISELDNKKILISNEEFNAAYNPKREIIQAYNLSKAILNNPKYKFIIHCGYSHNSKEIGFMGYFLKKFGVDFISINQTYFNPHQTDTHYLKEYKENQKIEFPYVFINNKNDMANFNKIIEAGADIYVCHNDPQYFSNFENRFGFIKKDTIQINPYYDKENLPNKFLIYKKEEYDILGCEAIPIFLFDVTRTNMETKIILARNSKYIFTRRNSKNQIFKKEIWMQ